MDSPSPLLEVSDLAVSFEVPGKRVVAVDGVSLSIEAGETLGIVGESGSGKSVLAYSLVGLLARNGRIDRGRIHFDGVDLRRTPRAVRAARGRGIAFIFQNPRSALNPIRRVGDQIRDVLNASGRHHGTDGRQRTIELLELVRIARARERVHAYPHELSGGMCQRILIAMAFAAQPKLLIADEPTTGLDVTTQKVVMDLLYELGQSQGLATLLITHDLGLAARYCGKLAVMCAGKVVESGTIDEVLGSPRIGYTQRLVAATPRPGQVLIELLPPSERSTYAHEAPAGESCAAEESQSPLAPLLDVRSLTKVFRSDRRRGLGHFLKRIAGHKDGPSAEVIYAVRNVSLSLRRGGTLGIVGESGSGKTTISRMIARLLDQTEGEIAFRGQDIGAIPAGAFARSPLRHRIQVVFQDPLGSLNPRFIAYEAIANPLRRHEPNMARDEEKRRIVQAAIQSGLDPALLSRFPHQLSGGQQARVGIARAVVVGPDLLILDEPTSALDVSVQAIVLNQLDLLRRKLGVTYVLVSHDLNVVRLMCDNVLVMRSGEIVEAGEVEVIFQSPVHPYTRELIDAIPHLQQHAAELV